MAGEYNLIPCDRLFARIEDKLNSYAANGVMDSGRFYDDVKFIINKLGIPAYDFTEGVVKLENYRAELPCEFYLLDSAWLCHDDCSDDEDGTFSALQSNTVIYTDISCETVLQKDNCHGEINKTLNNGIIIEANSCTNNNELILDKVTIKEYIQGSYNTKKYFKQPTLLTLKNKANIGEVCTKGCKNIYSKRPEEISITSSGYTKFLNSNLKSPLIYLKYYKYPIDPNTNLPLIPELPIIQEAIMWKIIYEVLFGAWLNGDDVNIERKIKEVEIRMKDSLAEAKAYTKIPSFNKSVEMARRVRRKFAAYELINTPNRW